MRNKYIDSVLKEARAIEKIAVLSNKQVQMLTGLSRDQILKLEHLGQFPQRLRLSALRVGWRTDEIRAWILSRPREMAYCCVNEVRKGSDE
jgi:predicted DNA-binding transcriptional regulator AlpA